MNSLGVSLRTLLHIPSGSEQTGARSCGAFHTSSGTDCTKARQSSLRVFMEDEIRGLIVLVFARAPNPRLQRTRAARSPLSRKPLGASGKLWRASVGISHRYLTWKGLTRDCSIRSLLIRDERVRGRYATVLFTLTLKSGKRVRDSERLVRRADRWLIG